MNEPSGATLCPFFANDIFCVICFNENVNENEKLLECVSLAGPTHTHKHTHRHSQINMPRPRLAICLLRTVAAVAVVVVDVVRIVPTMERTCNSQKQLGWQLKQAPPLSRPPPSLLPSQPASCRLSLARKCSRRLPLTLFKTIDVVIGSICARVCVYIDYIVCTCIVP